jgi:hypothetical protein
LVTLTKYICYYVFSVPLRRFFAGDCAGEGERRIWVGGGMLDVLLLKFFFRLRLAETVQQHVAWNQSYVASAGLVIFTGSTSMRRGQINGLAVRRWGASFSILLSRHLESVLSKKEEGIQNR